MSDTIEEKFIIVRTWFHIGNEKVSVINGVGTYGNKEGLLEMWCKAIDPEPIGWLTADGVIEKIKELME